MEFETIVSAKDNQTAKEYDFVLPYVNVSPVKSGIYIVVCCVSMLWGIPSNVLAVVAVFKSKKLRQPVYLFIASLGAADVLVSSIVLAFSIVGVVLGEEFFHMNWRLCHLFASLCILACNSAWWNITSLSVNRMINAYFPLTYKKIYTWKVTPFIMLIAWALGVLTIVPNVVGWGSLQFDPEMSVCLFDVDFWEFNIIIACAVLFAISLAFGATVATILKIMRLKRMLDSVVGPVDTLMNISSSAYKHNVTAHLKREVEESTTTLRILVALFCGTLLFWTPFVVLLLSEHIVHYSQDTWAFANLLGHIQPGFDGLIYPVFHKEFRAAYKRLLCGKKSGYKAVAASDTDKTKQTLARVLK